MPVSEELIIQIKSEVDKALSDLKKVESQTQSLGKTSSKVFSDMAKIAAGVAIAFVGMSAKAIQAFETQEKAEAKLNATLKATEYAAGLTANELTEMAKGLQKVGVLGDEAIIEAQAMLLTFKQIGGDIFPRVTEAAADMALMFGGGPGGLQSASIMLGKALNDPIQGLSALRRVGIQLTAEQEKMVRGFVDVNNIAAAQDVILKEVESQFGGLNREMAQTRTGQIQQLKNSFGDLMERIGETELAAVSFANKFVQAGIDAADAIIGFASSAKGIEIISDAMGKIAGIFAVIGKTVGPPVEAVFKGLDKIFRTLKKESDELFNGVDQGAGAMNALAITSQLVTSVFNVLTTAVSGVITNVFNFVEIIKSGWGIMFKFFDAMADPFNIKKWEETGGIIMKTGDDIKTFVGGLVETTVDLGEEIIDQTMNFAENTKKLATDIEIAYTTTYNNVSAAVEESLGKIGEDTTKTHEELQEDIYDKYRNIETFGGDAWRGIGNAAKEVNEDIIKSNKKMAENTINTMGDILEKTIEAGLAGEDMWKSFGMAAKEAIAGAVKGFGKQWAVQAAAAWIPGPTFNPVAAAGLTAASLAAYAAAAIIPSFARGGSFVTNGPQLMQVGDNPGGQERVTVEPLSSYGNNENGGKMFHITIYLGSKIVYDEVNEGLQNNQIIVPESAIT